MPGSRRSAFEFGPFRLDTVEHVLSRDGRRLPLTPKVYDVLRLLVEHAGHLVEKEQLLQEVWPHTFVEEGALTRSISVLRKTLGDTAAERYIETVPKRGYRFVAAVRPATSGEAAVVPPGRAWPGWRRSAVVAAVLLGTLLSSLQQFIGAPAPAAAAVHQQVTLSGNDDAATLSANGRHIAYVSAAATEKRLIVRQVEDGQPVVIFAAPELGYLRWSPDGSQLLYWARGAGYDGIYAIAQPGGVPRLIRRGQFVACWSPDGRTIAVTSYLTGKIWLHDLAGNELRTLTLQHVTWSIWDLDWSPENGRLLFVSSDPQGAYTVWTMSDDGREQLKLFESRSEISGARWSEDGTAIYFLQRSNQTASVEKFWPATGKQVSLLSGLEAGHSFAISRDGTRLAYARAPFHSNLWRLDLTGTATGVGATTELTRGTSLIERPRISPDGTRVLFNVGHRPHSNLFTMPIAGGAMTQVTFLDSFNVGGAWSRDGARVAFASTEGGSARVWIVAADGGTPRPLAAGGLSESLDLVWAPGRRILFQQAGNRNYGAFDPESRDQRVVARDGSVGWMFSPAYSPDGRSIAVAWNRKPDRGIWVVDAQDGTETFVHKTGPGTMVIGWSKDGSAIYAVDGKTAAHRGALLPIGETIADARILEVPVNGAPIKIVAALPGAEIGGVTMTPDARRFVYTMYSSRSDVWVADNFDAAVPRRDDRR
jgi:Tol biopolymer transport system component/DNA-binding winged helix-turn-helix (wHTH) protein